ncbi:hypothetical protein TWF225_005715 [Orbilia oligospora]|nr:hypothetical protein TWF751_010359 [Orbilia oligospora]KAF3185240.1 hypothetical protein TWF225_005715 [Orbilia oligospora]KAF3244929.1 hypothetical protein TWF128_009631 [Orbilia oligospora]KAF3253896.1 hypothetical protein TWF217_007362 [Orbilia oligospora]
MVSGYHWPCLNFYDWLINLVPTGFSFAILPGISAFISSKRVGDFRGGSLLGSSKFLSTFFPKRCLSSSNMAACGGIFNFAKGFTGALGSLGFFGGSLNTSRSIFSIGASPGGGGGGGIPLKSPCAVGTAGCGLGRRPTAKSMVYFRKN